MKNFLKILIPSVLFLLVVFVIGTNLTKPFWGEHDWNGARYGNIAKNYLRYGYVLTKFGQVENGGISNPTDFIYYTHYQPLLPILISASYRFFGVSEFTTRLVPLLSTAGFILMVYFIGSQLISWKMGIFSSLLALATPMVRYYGKNPVHEPLALFFSSLTFLGLLKKNKWLLLTGIVLTALTNWSFVFLIAGISVFLMSKKNIKKITGLCALGIFFAAFHFIHVKILTGSFLGGDLVGALLERTSVDQVVTKFNFIQYLLQIRLWFSTLFTNTLLLSAVVGIVVLLRSKLLKFKKFILAVLVYCLYPIFFTNASFIHSYFVYYFILPLCLLGGFVFVKLLEFKKILLFLFLFTLLGVWFERNSYVKALNASDGDKLAVEIAKSVQDKTGVSDTISVKPDDYAESRLPILSFYSERNMVSSRKTDWLVTITGGKYEIIKESTK